MLPLTHSANVLLARTITILFAVTALIALSAMPAQGSTRQKSVIEDSGRILSWDPAARSDALDEMRQLEADIVKIPVSWREITVNGESRRRPNINLTDPDNYPAHNWSRIDSAVAGATARGMQVWLMITAPAPRWAVRRETSPGKGAYKPDPTHFGRFVEAVAKRYPDVRYWSIWNEPNLSRFIKPQYKRGVVVSAVHYRKMYKEAYKRLTRNGHRRDTIMFGELLPRAPKPRRVNGTVPPVMWLREFFCLDENLRPFRGREKRRHDCSRFRRIHASGFAYHPYTTTRGPLWYDKRKDSATIHHLGRIYKVLDAAYKTRHLSKRRIRIYNSEFGFQTRPPDRHMIPMSRVPTYLNTSELMSYRDSRSATYAQYLLIDDHLQSGFQTGLRFNDGKKKHRVYQAFQLPVMVVKRTSRSVWVWGKLRNLDDTDRTVEIQMRVGRHYRTLKTVKVNSRTGYFTRVVPISRANKRIFRLQAGELTSRRTRPASMPRMRR